MTKGTKRTLEDADPDYDDYADVPSQEIKRQKIIEETGKEETTKKITDILTKQFEEQGSMMEDTIMDIEDQLQECRQVMERLRGWLVTGYYQNGAEANADVPTIHPTVKQHLGKAPRNVTKSEKPPTPAPVAVKQEPEPVSTVSRPKVAESPKRGGRFRSKKTVIVGNVSMFIPAQKRDEHDRASHKWMVYVRGPKDRPDISDYVQKVLFLLDRSYFPNDVVEVTEAPFTLTRRGWGEFKIRVQLFFHDKRNKKVDIIHPIKLDRTYTGLQTLGAETTVEIELEKDKADVFSQPKHPKTVSRQLSLDHKASTVDHEKQTSADTSPKVPTNKDSAKDNANDKQKATNSPEGGSKKVTQSPTTPVATPIKTESSTPNKGENSITTSTPVSIKSNTILASKPGTTKVSSPATPTSVYCIISPSKSGSATSTPQFLAIPSPISQQGKMSATLLPQSVQIKGDRIVGKPQGVSQGVSQGLSPATATLLRAPGNVGTGSSPRSVIPGAVRLSQLRAMAPLAGSPKRGASPGTVLIPGGVSGVSSGQRIPQMSMLPAGQMLARSPSGQIYCLLKSPSQLITVRPGTSAVASVSKSPATVPSADKLVPGILQRSALPGSLPKTLASTTLLKQAVTTSTLTKQGTVPAVSLIKSPRAPGIMLKQQVSPQLAVKAVTSTSNTSTHLIQVSNITTQGSISKAQFVLATSQGSTQASVSTGLKPTPIIVQPGPQSLLAGGKAPQTLVLQGLNPSIRGTGNAVSLLRGASQTSPLLGKKQVSLLTGKTLISGVDKTGAPTIMPPSISSAQIAQINASSSGTQEVQRRILGLDKSRTLLVKSGAQSSTNTSTSGSNLIALVVPKDVTAGQFENIEAIVRYVVRFHPLIYTAGESGNCNKSDRTNAVNAVNSTRESNGSNSTSKNTNSSGVKNSGAGGTTGTTPGSKTMTPTASATLTPTLTPMSKVPSPTPAVPPPALDRSQHPYGAGSEAVWRGWGVAKRRASEWCRACAIRRDVAAIIRGGGGGGDGEGGCGGGGGEGRGGGSGGEGKGGSGGRVRDTVKTLTVKDGNAQGGSGGNLKNTTVQDGSGQIGVGGRKSDTDRTPTIKDDDLEFEGEKLWSRRDIVLWCRNHCYTPIDDELKSRWQKGTAQWFGEYSSLSEPPTMDFSGVESGPRVSLVYDSDSSDAEELDVIGDPSLKPPPLSPYKQRIAAEERRKRGVTIPAPTATPEASAYVNSSAAALGLDLTAPAELAPGVFVNGVPGAMVWAACRGLVEDIVRQAAAVGVNGTGGHGGLTEEITANEVFRALVSIPVCDFLTNKGLGTKCTNSKDREK